MASASFPSTQLQDCQTITKAFERGCNHSMTEESVYAMMTPQLNTMRSTSKAVSRIAADNLIKSNLNTQTNTEQSSIVTGKQIGRAHV